MAEPTDRVEQARTRIDVGDADDVQRWAQKLDTTAEQIEEAVQAVGDSGSDVESHLKGSRSTTNSERTAKALQEDEPPG